MASPTRTPPRFVPTLTTVLDLPAEPVAAHSPLTDNAGPDADAPAMPDPAQAVALPPAVQRSEADIVRLEQKLRGRSKGASSVCAIL